MYSQEGTKLPHSDDKPATALRLQPGVLDAHTEECDVYNGEVALVLQTAERPGSQRRFTRVRTMGCASGWIDSRYLLPREEYERQKYDRQREEYERQRQG